MFPGLAKRNGSANLAGVHVDLELQHVVSTLIDRLPVRTAPVPNAPYADSSLARLSFAEVKFTTTYRLKP